LYVAELKPRSLLQWRTQAAREVEVVDRANEPAWLDISFGRFRLLPARRLLLEGDQPVRIGSRALDLLIALAERPGELVSKSELVAKVWPCSFVGEGNLKVHIGGAP